MKQLVPLALAASLAGPLAVALAAQDAETRPAPVTFTEHVAPILFASCVSCHRPGEVAPFPLIDYADVRKRARMIVKVTESRFMPPWHPVEGHGEFVDEARLSDEEIATLRAWVAGGMPEGDPGRLPALPSFTEGWQLGEPDLIVRMPAAYTVRADGPDIYRNFVVPVQLDRDEWLTAIEVRPSARSALHHVIFSFDTTGQARRLDGRDGEPGFFGMGGVGGDRLDASTAGLGGWAVGGMPRHLPMGLARRLPKGADLILRSHFHPSGKAESEQTTLGLYFTDTPPKHTMLGLQLPPAFGFAAGLDVPAGSADFTIRDSFTLPVPALAVSVGGHAHYICKDMHVTCKLPDGSERSVFWIDDWDFNWQNHYQYREPLELPAGTEVSVSITYDNSAGNPNNPFDPPRRIRWGLQSTDEMGSVTLLLVPKDEADARELQQAIRRDARDKLSRPRALRGIGASIAEQIKELDRDGDGLVERSEVPQQYQRFFDRIDRDGDGAVTIDEIDALGEQLAPRRRGRDGGEDREGAGQDGARGGRRGG